MKTVTDVRVPLTKAQADALFVGPYDADVVCITLTGTASWSDVSSQPRRDIADALIRLCELTGGVAVYVFFGVRAWHDLRFHPDTAADAYDGTLARLFDVPGVEVARMEDGVPYPAHAAAVLTDGNGVPLAVIRYD